MEINRNRSLENLTEEVDGVIYEEEWRDIQGYEGKYQISSFGRAKSLNYSRSGKPAILSICDGPHGYQLLSLCKNGKRENKFIHILVAKAFIDNPENKPTVQHKWYIKTDNRVHQLEWFTHKEQNVHAWKTGRREHVRKIASKNAVAAYTSNMKVVYQYALSGRYMRSYKCLADAGRAVNKRAITVWDSAVGRKITAGGFRWSYEKYKNLTPDKYPVYKSRRNKNKKLSPPNTTIK